MLYSFIYLLSCSSSSIIFDGYAPSAGNPEPFVRRCMDNDPQALLLRDAMKTSDCQTAWNTLSTIENIDVSAVEIHDLSLFSGMTNLKKISAYDNKIQDVSPLIPLDRMKELYLMSNEIEDISPLIHLRQLQVLRLDGNKVRDISILPKLKRLNRLGLDQNNISDFRPIAKLDDIQALNTNFNPVNVEYCPIEGTGPEQLHKYCKRMHKHQKKTIQK